MQEYLVVVQVVREISFLTKNFALSNLEIKIPRQIRSTHFLYFHFVLTRTKQQVSFGISAASFPMSELTQHGPMRIHSAHNAII